MKCPNCGQEMQEEHLYCEKCGMEIRIVPDFEPEIENSITETLSTVAEEIDNKKITKAESGQRVKVSFFTDNAGKNWLLVKGIAFAVIFLVSVIAGLIIYFNYSVSYQISRARDCAKWHNYEEAVKHLDRAMELDPGNTEIVLLQSNYYYKMNEADQGISALLQLLEKEQLSDEELESVYNQIISIYDEQGKYEEINNILLACPHEKIVTLFQNYMAMPPKFSSEAGSYDYVVSLKLSANMTGKIYYTLDGSEPTVNSSVYMAPIFLESGNYQVNAFFVNDYGIVSETVRKRYEINVTVPDKPQVILYSGKYEMPTYIEVLHPAKGTVYYTTDGSEPTTDSLVYTEPIFMPLGHSNFKFAVISEEGVSSEVVSRSFEFKMDTNVTTAVAASNVMRALMNRDILKDMQGHATGKPGKYKFEYNTIVQIEEKYYYVLDEYYEDQNGNKSKTGLLYAVEVYTGAPNRLVYDEQGQMGVISLSD